MSISLGNGIDWSKQPGCCTVHAHYGAMLLKIPYTLMTVCHAHSALLCVHVETSCKCSGKMQQTISMPAKVTLEETLEDIQSEAGREIVMKMSSAFSLFG